MFQLILFALLFGLFVYRRMERMSILKRSGIPGPKPNLITGNFFDFLFKPNVLKLTEYQEKFGKVFGYYLGSEMVVNVTDLSLIQEIQTKNFSQFSAKSPISNEFHDIGSQSGGIWKKNRTILSGAFNGAKLKAMSPTINSNVQVLMNKVGEQARLGGEFNIYEHLKPLTMDVMASVMMGVDAKFQENPDVTKRMFQQGKSEIIGRFITSLKFDCFINQLYRFSGYARAAYAKQLNRFVSNVFDFRSSSGLKRNDLIQSILDSNMSRDEAVQNTSYLFSTDSQMISSALSFAFHFLVNHPEVQAKVRQEITEHLSEEKKFDYESMSKLTYLQAVIYETLRFLPPSTNLVTRYSSEDFHYQDMTLPKNSLIAVPLHQLHHTEEYWPKHDQFNPERFLDKSNANSTAFQPFGAGPRICVGARFAMLQMKLILAQLLSKYEFVTGPSTEKELTLEYELVQQKPANGVWLKAVPIN